jgi:hypothetical protein
MAIETVEKSTGAGSKLQLRLAMWSGPRNISTALMRSWGNRTDTFVSDEPLYAHYLQKTRVRHPGAEEVMANHETDWRKVVAAITGPIPEGKTIWYQKHMAHHLLPEIDRKWLNRVVHCFLIRNPSEMLTSLTKNVPEPGLADTGLPQQLELFAYVRHCLGRIPPILDARDVLENPRRALTMLCEAVGVAFSESMLSWAPGRRSSDGIWARYWYDAVEKSTGFEPYRPKSERVPDSLAPLLEQCRAIYEKLFAYRLAP